MSEREEEGSKEKEGQEQEQDRLLLVIRRGVKRPGARGPGVDQGWTRDKGGQGHKSPLLTSPPTHPAYPASCLRIPRIRVDRQCWKREGSHSLRFLC